MKKHIHHLSWPGGSVVKFSDDLSELANAPQDGKMSVSGLQIARSMHTRAENICNKEGWPIWGTGGKNGGIHEKCKPNQPVIINGRKYLRRKMNSLLSWNQYINKNNFLRPPMVTTYECSNVLWKMSAFQSFLSGLSCRLFRKISQ